MRLVTRADLDGLTAAVLITEAEGISDILLIHPQDITDKKVEITGEDVLANLPYHPACGKWFDHHLLTDSNEKPPEGFKGAYAAAASAARVVYDHYLPAHPKLARFASLVDETDRLDAALLTKQDVLNPQGYILLGLLLDPRTGLGAFHDFFHLLRRELSAGRTPPEILAIPDVADRARRLREQDETFRAATERCSKMVGKAVFTDFRNESPVPVGNRFLVYTLFPDANVSLRVHWGPGRQTVAATVGHSIFNRTCMVSVGELMSKYGGGGHRGAGTCLLPVATADANIEEILAALKG